MSRLLKDDRKSHFLIVLLAGTNLLLLTILFLAVTPKKSFFAEIVPISANTPVVRFSLISPQENSTISGTVPLVTTLSNGPRITQAKLTIGGKEIQTVFSQETEKLTVFWDTRKVTNGNFQVSIRAYDDQGGISQLYTGFKVENKQEDQQQPIR